MAMATALWRPGVVQVGAEGLSVLGPEEDRRPVRSLQPELHRRRVRQYAGQHRADAGAVQATERRLVISGEGAQLAMKDSMNVVVEKSKSAAIDGGKPTRVKVDGKII